jgi:ABC-type oligopeptide transport system ATPase subunit
MPQWWEANQQEVTTVWQALTNAEGIEYYFNTVTRETSWDKPEELMTDEEKASGSNWFWVPHEEECYVPGLVLGQQGTKSTVELEDGTQQQVNTKELMPLKKASLHPKRVVADLTLLDEMSAPLILWNLKARFLDDKIYTNVGNILISVNPYKDLGLYTHAVTQRYINRGVEERDPHVYNTAYDAWIGLTEFKMNQSIIISGESGAGKTEATKQCLKYLAATAGSVGGVEKKILQANPILEAFGNAKTLRNDNSSRFGKYMEIFFTNTKPTMIIGSTTTNYLLEKIRVVAPGDGERNYHIFYMVTKAADGATKQKLALKDPASYRYLDKCVDVPTFNDAGEYKALIEAFGILLFSKQEQDDIHSILGAILHNGNGQFSGGNKVALKDASVVQIAAKLFQVEQAAMEKALLFRTLKIPGQKPTDVPHSQLEAAYARDALSKFVYGNMFDWIVQKVNLAMGKCEDGLMSIGILDIFGFEIFKSNSFEQLCINFTNEMLQQHFNQNTFKLEQQLYQSEKIVFETIDFIDNAPMLELIQKKPTGIIPILDEELVVPRGSDKGFLEKLEKAHSGKTPCFKHSLKVPDSFIVCHYAGEVLYHAPGFLDKNRDRLTEDMLILVQGSPMPLLKTLFPPERSVGSNTQKNSLGSQFCKQLNALMDCLNKTEPHYIRCVKPNERKAQMEFVPRNCFEQLTYSGVFEAVAIRKKGFPFRLKHKEFLERYKVIVPNANAPADVIKDFKFNPANVQMGKTMVLYRAEEHKTMELKRSIKVKSIQIEENLKELTTISVAGMSAEDKEEYLNRLGKAVMEADQFRLKTPTAEKARNLLDGFIQARLDGDPECKRKLESANASKDQKELESAIEMADLRGYQACHYVRKTKELLKQVQDATEKLQREKELLAMTWQTDGLKGAIANAESFGYNSMLVQESMQLVYRIDRIAQEVAAAAQTYNEHHIKSVVQAADEIGYVDQMCDYFRELVRGDYDRFLVSQYDKSVEIQDHARAIRIMVKRKDILIKKQGEQFVLKTYPKLKKPEDWAKEKFFGSKVKLAMDFLKWQKNSIHSHMCNYTNWDKKTLGVHKKALTNGFKAFQNFMKLGPVKDNPKKMSEFVNHAKNTKELRDELYIYCIKQTTSCPPEVPADQQDRGWQFLGLLMNTFPPSPELENVLESYIRRNEAKADKYRLKFLIRRRVYEGDSKVVPSESDFQNASASLSKNTQGFDEPQPTGQEPYQELITYPYFDLEVTSYVSCSLLSD